MTQPTQPITGAMVALVPSPEDIERLTVPGGESPDILHLTLFYLGEAEPIDLTTRTLIVQEMQKIAAEQTVINCYGFGVAMWNPDGTACVVLNVDGESLLDVRDNVEDELDEIWSVWLPKQHNPWVPHVALQYTDDASVVGTLTDRVGPIKFDRIRVAFADEATDIPLLPTDTILASGGVMAGKQKKQQCDDATVDLATSPASSGEGEPADTGPTEVEVEVDAPASSGVAEMPDAMPTGAMDFAEEGAWEGILVVEGIETGDGREFSGGALTFADTPAPLLWQEKTADGHGGSVIVARIDEMWRDEYNPAVIRGRGVFDLGSDAGKEAYRQVQGGFLKGISVDVDNIKDADVEYVFPEGDPTADDDLLSMFMMPDKTIFHAGRIRGATLVALPAFVEAQIWLAGQSAPDMMQSPMVSGDGMMMSVEPHETDVVDTPWDGADTESSLASRFSLEVARSAYAWVNANAVRSGTVTREDCLFLHHVIEGGQVRAANVTACLVGMRVLLSNAASHLSMAARRRAYEHLATHVRHAGLIPQTFAVAPSADVSAVLTAAVVAGPPAAWFADPKLSGPTPLTITEDGRIFGHAALFGTCHVGIQDLCMQPPFESRHDYFLLGEVVTASGESVAVGSITLGTGHASVNARLTPQQALEHYDNTGTRVADVVTGNDQFGIWVAGAVRSDISSDRLDQLRAAKLSGDWRRIGGELRLVALLAVNVPGFPVPRSTTRVVYGQQSVLVASGIVPDVLTRKSDENEGLRKIRLSIARRIGRDPASRRAALRSRVHREG